jgi:hypothetical protein
MDKSDLVTFMNDGVASRCDHAPFRDFITVFLIVCLNSTRIDSLRRLLTHVLVVREAVETIK